MLETQSVGKQTLSTTSVSVNYQFFPAPTQAKVVSSYSKAIQTSDSGLTIRRKKSRENYSDSGSDASQSSTGSSRKLKRRSQREREREEELRQNLRKEIEEELKAVKEPTAEVALVEPNYPARPLTDEELNAVTASDDFLDFVERSSKVIEKALDQDYDVLVNYAQDNLEGADSDPDEVLGKVGGKKGRRIRPVAQFYDESWNKKRMISDIDFSPKASSTFLALVAN